MYPMRHTQKRLASAPLAGVTQRLPLLSLLESAREVSRGSPDSASRQRAADGLYGEGGRVMTGAEREAARAAVERWPLSCNEQIELHNYLSAALEALDAAEALAREEMLRQRSQLHEKDVVIRSLEADVSSLKEQLNSKYWNAIREENTRLKEEADAWKKRRGYKDELVELHHLLRKQDAALRLSQEALENGGEAYESVGRRNSQIRDLCCFYCGAEPDSHDPDCTRQAALAAITDALERHK